MGDYEKSPREMINPWFVDEYEKALKRIQWAAETGRTKLALRKLGLKCLPPEIGQLTNLQRIRLNGGRLVTLPPEIGQLVNLVRIGLRRNKVATLPPEIGQLVNLREFSLEDNCLTALPAEIGQLRNLQLLDLNGNRLTTLPPEIGQLHNLQYLDLNGNQLTTLPPEIGGLTKLKRLDLNGNHLEALPPEIGQLTNLKELYLNGNRLTTLPPEISQLTNLSILHLDNNPLRFWPEQGPAEVKWLSLADCTQLTCLPDWLERVYRLDVPGCERLNRLPDHLRIFVWVDLADTGITSLPPVPVPDIAIRWRGVRVDRHIAFTPEFITVKAVFLEMNLELRRVMVERMGNEKFMREANPKVLDEDIDRGGVRRLLRVRLPGDGFNRMGFRRNDEPFVGLEVIDPSTGRQYILRVPPTMLTCHRAAAWIAGFDDPDDYHPIEET